MKRNRKILAIVSSAALVGAVVLLFLMKSEKAGRYAVYIGGYGKAAVRCVFNANTYDLSVVGDFKALNPSYLALSPSEGRIYGVNETGRSSGVWGYGNSTLEQSLGTMGDRGSDPCFITCFKGHLFTANYGKGGVSVFPLDTSGRIKAPVQIINFVSDNNKAKVSRSHMVKFVTGKKSKNDYILVSDKGLDGIHIMRVGEDTSSYPSGNLLSGKALRLYRCDSAFVGVPEGYGPRHMELSKDGKFMYLLCETSGRIIVYSIRESGGNIVLRQLQDVVCDYENNKASADIHLSPDGRFLYASNRRGKDGIAIFKVDEDGLLSRIAYQVTDQWPRSFAITPDGEFMFVCCQKDKCVQVFRIDQSSGYLINTGKKLAFPDFEPSCVIVGKV